VLIKNFDIKKTISLFLVGIVFFNFFLFLNPKKTEAANTCKNKNTTPVIGYPYKKETKDNLPKNDLLKVKITDNKTFSKSSVKLDLLIKYVSRLSNKTFWVQYTKPGTTDHAYVQYSVSANIEHISEGKKIEDIPITLTSSGTTKITRNYPIDNKEHQFKVKFFYRTTGEYCETNTGAFSGEPGKYVYNGAFELEDQLVTNFYNDKCKDLKGQVETQICRSVKCLRELYEGGAGAGVESSEYWNPGAKPPSFDELMSGSWTSNDLTSSGYAQLQQCKRENQTLQQLTDQYKSANCTDDINWKNDCHFNPNFNDPDNPLGTPLDPNGDPGTVDTLPWFVNKISKVTKKIGEIPTQGSSNDACKKSCDANNFTQIPEKYVCRALCWVSTSFMNLFKLVFELLSSAITTETDEYVKPNIAPYLEESGTSGSGGSGADGGTGDTGGGAGGSGSGGGVIDGGTGNTGGGAGGSGEGSADFGEGSGSNDGGADVDLL